MSEDESVQEQAEAVATLLQTSARLFDELLGDPLVRRLLQLFQQMPASDRPVLIDVLAREVSLRVETQDLGKRFVGCSPRINPNARLYLRTFEKVPEPSAPALGHEEMVFANLRAARLIQLVLAPHLFDAWRAAAAEAFAQLDAEERATMSSSLQTMLDLLHEVEPTHRAGAHAAG